MWRWWCRGAAFGPPKKMMKMKLKMKLKLPSSCRLLCIADMMRSLPLPSVPRHCLSHFSPFER